MKARLTLFNLIAFAGFAFGQSQQTNTKGVNIDTAAERLAFQTAIGSNFQPKGANFTAEKNGRYIATSTLTVTDPSTPTNGDAFWVLVRGGTATIGGTAYTYSAADQWLILRSYNSGAWTNTAIPSLGANNIWSGTKNTFLGQLALGDDTSAGQFELFDSNGNNSSIVAFDLSNGGILVWPNGAGTFALVAGADGAIQVSDIADAGTMSTQNANNVSITGGSISGTISGSMTLTGAISTTNTLTNTGNDATNENHVMTRALSDARYSRPQTQRWYYPAFSTASTLVGTGTATAATAPPMFQFDIPAAGDAAKFQLDKYFHLAAVPSGTTDDTQFGRHNIELSWKLTRAFQLTKSYSLIFSMGVPASNAGILTGTNTGIQLELKSIASTSLTAQFIFGDGTSVTTSSAVNFTNDDPDQFGWWMYRIQTNATTREIKFQRCKYNSQEWTDVLVATYPVGLNNFAYGGSGIDSRSLNIIAVAGATPPVNSILVEDVQTRLLP